MEVASPLPFAHNSSGNKRHLSCSPGFSDSTNRSPFAMGMEVTDDYVQQRNFKRRRFNADETMESDVENISSQTTLLTTFSPHGKAVFPSSNDQPFKRRRATTPEVHGSPHHDNNLHRTVETQAAEIQNLKSDKSQLESSLGNLKGEHERVLNENRILKKAVTIQQERQNQTANELEAARQYKINAEEQIRKLEQLILSLRYHLQAQQPTHGNDFMGFPPRPPDVY